MEVKGNVPTSEDETIYIECVNIYIECVIDTDIRLGGVDDG